MTCTYLFHIIAEEQIKVKSIFKLKHLVLSDQTGFGFYNRTLIKCFKQYQSFIKLEKILTCKSFPNFIWKNSNEIVQQKDSNF